MLLVDEEGGGAPDESVPEPRAEDGLRLVPEEATCCRLDFGLLAAF